MSKPTPETLMIQLHCQQLRESIAANVEGLGCANLRDDDPEHRCWVSKPIHGMQCPISIAAAIREGRL